MATLNGSDFVSRFNNSSTGAFKSGQNRGIGSDDMRDLVESINDSFINAIDELQLLTSTAGTNAYTLVGDLDAYATGFMVAVKVVNASTGASTLNINSLGAKKLYKNPTTQVGNGDLVANQAYICIYDAALDSANGGFHVIGLGGGESYTAETPIEIVDGVVKFTGGNFSVPIFNLTVPSSGRMFIADSGFDIVGNVYLLLRAREFDVQHAQVYLTQNTASLAVRDANDLNTLFGIEFDQGTGSVKMYGIPEGTGPKAVYFDPATNELSYDDSSGAGTVNWGDIGGGDPTMQEDLTSYIESQLNALETEINGSIGTLANDLNDLTSYTSIQVSAINSDISDLEAQIASIQNKMFVGGMGLT